MSISLRPSGLAQVADEIFGHGLNDCVHRWTQLDERAPFKVIRRAFPGLAGLQRLDRLSGRI
jgi:hypothetical protein